MDGNLKMSPAPGAARWDLAELELEHDADPLASLCGIGIATSPQEYCSSVDLKLGALGQFGTAADSHGVGKMPAASAGSSLSRAAKRLRAMSGGVRQQQWPSCTVDGCGADLDSCGDYHRRHKMCEAHSKTPVVAVGRSEMRFCQQCSRFELLKEFDEAKRSCRKRLEGHNRRRRRKPRPDARNYARFMTSQQGARFSSFPIPRPPEQNRQGIMETDNLYYTHRLLGISSNRQRFVGSTSSTKGKEGWHFPFLHQAEAVGINLVATTGVALETSVCQQPLLETLLAPVESSSSNSNSNSNSKMFCEGLITPVLHSESDSALSLLSATPHFSAGIDDDVSHMVQQTEHIPIVQPFFSNLQLINSSSCWSSRSHASTGAVSATGYSCSVVVNEQLNPVLSPDNSDMNYNRIFHFGGQGSSDSASPSLPLFPWH